MADEIDKTISSISELNKVVSYGALEFQGFKKSLLEAASGTESASKRWTIFSRLVSGTPLWKMQNYLRGALGVLAEMENTSKANANAMKEQNEKIVNQIKGFRSLKKEVETANQISKLQLRSESEYNNIKTKQAKIEKKYQAEYRKGSRANLQKLQALGKENRLLKTRANALKDTFERVKAGNDQLLDKIKDTDEYNKVLMATNDARKAEVTATIQINKQMEVQRKQMKLVARELRENYAFDKSRLDVAQKIAKESAIGKGKGRFGQAIAMMGAKGKEKRQMRKDQAFAVEERKDELKSASKIFSKKNFSTALMPAVAALAPLGGLFKLTKSALLPWGKDARKTRIKILKFGTRIVKVTDFLFKYMMLGIIVAGAILVGMKYFQELYGILSEMGVVDRIKDLGSDLMSILGDVFSIVSAFFSGDYEKIVPLLERVFDKGVLFLLKTLGVLLDVGFLALVAAFKLVGDFIVKFLDDPAFQEKIFKGLKVLGLFIATFIIAKYIIAQLVLLAGIAALPIAFGIVILAAGYTIGKYFGDRISKRFQPLIDGVKWLIGLLQKIRESVSDFGRKIRKLPGFANGGVSAGGLAVVGERGPELVNLPAGSQVHSNSDSKKMMGGTVNNFNITINAKDTSDQELRRIADKIGQMVNTKINRTTSSRTFGG